MTTDEAVEVLLVEDNLHDIELTLRALKRHNLANTVHVARDGEEALDYIFGTGADADRNVRHRPKIILLDLNLPKVDGLRVLRRIKSDKNTSTIPVIMLTSSREEEDMLNSYELGANSYIVKPVDFKEFVDSVGQFGLYWLLLNQQPS